MGRNIESGSERPTSRSRRRNDGHRIVSGTCCNTARPSPKRRCLRSKHSRRDSLTGRHSGRAIVRSTFALRWTTFAWLANRSSRALASVSEGWSGLRGSNPCPRLGKPLYYHCTKPAIRELVSWRIVEWVNSRTIVDSPIRQLTNSPTHEFANSRIRQLTNSPIVSITIVSVQLPRRASRPSCPASSLPDSAAAAVRCSTDAR
jgi:hypothetical protein